MNETTIRVDGMRVRTIPKWTKGGPQKKLGERLKLPQGWEYGTQTLHEELVGRNEAGSAPAHLVIDEYVDNYQRIDNAEANDRAGRLRFYNQGERP